MDFFEHQEQARRHTTRLVLLFVAAVISLIVLSDLLVAGIFGFLDSEQYQNFTDIPLQIHFSIVGIILLTVSLAILYKLAQLRRGGAAVAEALGGKPIPTDTHDPDERKVINVVEEMAIASGTPAPIVYLLDDGAINAFAAGYTPHDAVIGVTRGALELLSRDELQGVIAHEFSHILNGDMRINLRLIGILFGILFIALAGERLIRVSARSRDSAALIWLGIGLMIIGYCGAFFGGMIKAAVSRQREFLADASAVQFTRNPEGIGGALKKIGGWSVGSVLASRNAAEYSHFYIAQGVNAFVAGFFSTHPPLAQRIKRIDPRWDGEYPQVKREYKKRSQPEQHWSRQATVSTFTTAALASAIAQTGAPRPEHLQHAQDLIRRIPEQLAAATRYPQGAYAVALGLILDSDATNWKVQIDAISLQTNNNILQTLNALLPQFAALNPDHRMPLLELCLPTLRLFSDDYRESFKRDLLLLIKADTRIKLWEWALYRIFMLTLNKPEPARARYSNPAQIEAECRLIIAAVAHVAENKTAAETAFFQGASKLGLSTRLPDLQNLRQSGLNSALQKIRLLKPLQKPAFLKALCATAAADGVINIREIELIRAIAESIDCPMPPLIP